MPVATANEELEVYVWRCMNLVQLGFTIDEAEALVAERVDYHYVEHLRTDLGYSAEQVKQVLL